MSDSDKARDLLAVVKANLRNARDDGSLTKLAFVARWLGTHHSSVNVWTARLVADGVTVNVSAYAYGHAGEGVFVQARTESAPIFKTVADTRPTADVRFFIPGKWFQVVEAHLHAAKDAHATAQVTAGRLNLEELLAMTTLPESLR